MTSTRVGRQVLRASAILGITIELPWHASQPEISLSSIWAELKTNVCSVTVSVRAPRRDTTVRSNEGHATSPIEGRLSRRQMLRFKPMVSPCLFLYVEFVDLAGHRDYAMCHIALCHANPSYCVLTDMFLTPTH